MRRLLAGVPYEVVALDEFPGVVLPPEGETSYADNALGKARAAAAGTGLLALGDDSGLEVDALGGGPGVVSARYGGPGLDDRSRYATMLEALRGVPTARRGAHFRSVIAIADPLGNELVVEGVADGVLLEAPRGSGGFGYDPIFFYPPLGAAFAELDDAMKDEVSHRGRAMRQAREALRRWPRAVDAAPR
jgi:XTP/dITP diphosphohydrolase